MLLKRIENEGEIVSLYESSNIFGSKFKDNELTVVFKTGSTYVYEDVSKTEFVLFETAESQGKVLNSKIKSKTFSKIDDTNLDKFSIVFDEANKQDFENGVELLKVNFDNCISNGCTKNQLEILKQTTEYLISLCK